jgi:hypothetical protein
VIPSLGAGVHEVKVILTKDGSDCSGSPFSITALPSLIDFELMGFSSNVVIGEETSSLAISA